MYHQQQQEEKLPFIAHTLWAYDKKYFFVLSQEVLFGGTKGTFLGVKCFFGGKIYQQQQQEEKLPFITQTLWAYDKKYFFVLSQEVLFGGVQKVLFWE